MANKNHELDDRIISAAMQEFMNNGYEKASMRKIASVAGVTIGAIYTRYRTKDILFCSLVKPLTAGIADIFASIRSQYFENTDDLSPESMASSMQMETDAILNLLFDHYSEAVLLLCKSRGSSLENLFDTIVEKKISSTLEFFNCRIPETNEKIHHMPYEEGVLRLLISGQFNIYYQIINGGFGLEEAKAMMKVAVVYHTGGWLTLFGKTGHEFTETSDK